jgi:hypothetical protein
VTWFGPVSVAESDGSTTKFTYSPMGQGGRWPARSFTPGRITRCGITGSMTRRAVWGFTGSTDASDQISRIASRRRSFYGGISKGHRDAFHQNTFWGGLGCQASGRVESGMSLSLRRFGVGRRG